MDIFDIQLATGHWNQSGTWTGDNNHDHLGQTWTGSNNPLKATGSFGTNPDNAALVLNNSAASGNGLEVQSANTGVQAGTASAYGTFVSSAAPRGARDPP